MDSAPERLIFVARDVVFTLDNVSCDRSGRSGVWAPIFIFETGRSTSSGVLGLFRYWNWWREGAARWHIWMDGYARGHSDEKAGKATPFVTFYDLDAAATADVPDATRMPPPLTPTPPRNEPKSGWRTSLRSSPY